MSLCDDVDGETPLAIIARLGDAGKIRNMPKM
jgi:hypothetical protein